MAGLSAVPSVEVAPTYATLSDAQNDDLRTGAIVYIEDEQRLYVQE